MVRGHKRGGRGSGGARLGLMAVGGLLLVSGCFDFDALRAAQGAAACDTPYDVKQGATLASCIADGAPKIDGRLDDWPGSFPLTVSYSTSAAYGGDASFTGNAAVDDQDSSATVAVRWDAEYLYVAARVRDDARGVHPSSGEHYLDDSIELFIDSNGDRAGPYGQNDFQCIFTADGRASLWKQSQLRQGQRCGTYRVGMAEGAGWTLEVAFPWSQIGGSATAGRVLGFDMILNDDDNPATPEQKHFLIWRRGTTSCPSECGSGACRPACSTKTFTLLQLGGA